MPHYGCSNRIEFMVADAPTGVIPHPLLPELRSELSLLLRNPAPLLIGRLGLTEMGAVWALEADPSDSCFQGADAIRDPCKIGAGVYSNNPHDFAAQMFDFARRYRDSIAACDAVTTPGYFFDQYDGAAYPKHCRIIRQRWLEPSALLPALAGKNVLVVTPFGESIKRQYAVSSKPWFSDFDYPEFQLQILNSPQTNGLARGPHRCWSETLQWLCDQVDALTFDIALIGAGGYTLPLAAHIRRCERKAICTGGFTVVYFGVTYHRIDEQHRKRGWHPYLTNPGWVFPGESERVVGFREVEEGCYW